MKRKPRVSLKFIKEPIPKKLRLSEFVIGKMQSAGIYPSPPVGYPQMLLIHQALDKSAAAASGGGSAFDYATQREAAKAWDTMMRKQARYVNGIADGNLAKIEAGGFSATVSETTRWQVPQILQSARIIFNNKTGGVDIKIKKTLFATAYNYLLVTDAATVKWEENRIKIGAGNTEIFHTCITKTKLNLRSLTPGTQYHVFVYPSGPAGMGGYPQPVSFIFPG